MIKRRRRAGFIQHMYRSHYKWLNALLVFGVSIRGGRSLSSMHLLAVISTFTDLKTINQAG